MSNPPFLYNNLAFVVKIRVLFKILGYGKEKCRSLKNLLIELAKITFDIYLKSTEIDIFELLKLLNDIREACT